MQIDKIYIISLDGDKPEAQQIIKDKLDDLGLENSTPFEIVKGFDGRSGTIPEGFNTYANWNLGDNTWNKWWKRPVLPGEVGCMVSHYGIWERIRLDGVNKALILEEDFLAKIPLKDIQFPGFPNHNWDIAFLGRFTLDPENETNIDSTWNHSLSNYNSHAYVVTKHAVEVLLDEYSIKENLIPSDEFLAATYTPHRREDIAELFPNKLSAIAVIEDCIVQKREQKDSTTELAGANLNLEEEPTKPYFEILDDSDWDAWKAKYLNHTLAKGEYDLMIDDLGNNILEFQLFTDKFCKEAIALAEVLDNWTIDRHEFYPTNDVLLPELGLDAIYSRVLKEVIYPLCIHYWKLEGTQWHNMQSENFLARYTTDRQSHLSLHHDFSHITMVVKLNDEFEGGGTWFPKYGVLSNPKNVGVATLHPGMVTHLHGARPISAGKRYICVSFMRQGN